MNTDTQIFYMPNYAKKVLLSFLILFIFIIFVSFGANQLEKQLASFSGIITALVRINPLEVRASDSLKVEINKVFKVGAKLVNKGEEKIRDAEGEVFLPSGLVLVKKDLTQGVGVIPGKKEKKVSWSIRGELAGSYIVIISGSGNIKGDEVFAQDSIEVNIEESLGGPRSTTWFQDFINLFRKWIRP